MGTPNCEASWDQLNHALDWTEIGWSMYIVCWYFSCQIGLRSVWVHLVQFAKFLMLSFSKRHYSFELISANHFEDIDNHGGRQDITFLGDLPKKLMGLWNFSYHCTGPYWGCKLQNTTPTGLIWFQANLMRTLIMDHGWIQATTFLGDLPVIKYFYWS